MNEYKNIADIIDTFFVTYKELSMDSDEVQKLQSSDKSASIWSYKEKSFGNINNKYLIVIPFDQTISISEESIEGINALKIKLEDNTFYLRMEYSRIIYVDTYHQFQSESKNKKLPKKINDLITFHTPKSLYEELFDFYSYDNYLIDNIEFRKVNKFYIDRKIKPVVDYNDSLPLDKHLQTLLQNWSLRKDSRNILLIGDRGMGKSWAVMDFCSKQNKRHNDNPWSVPSAVFIVLANFNDDENKKSGMWKAIFRHVKLKYKIKLLLGDASLEALIKIGNIILVLDGYDDMNKFVNKDTTYKQLFDLYSVVNESSKLVLTSRMNYFDSMMQIYEHFAFTTYKEKKSKSGFMEKHIAYTSGAIRSDFNIWRLDNMDQSEKEKLSNKYQSTNGDQIGEIILSKISLKKRKSFIEREIYNLSSIPAFRFAIIKLLSSNNRSKIQVYRDSIIMAVIGYNITTDRAIEQFTERYGENFSERPLDLDRKWNAIEDLSWFMFEKNMIPINKEYLRHFLLDTLDSDFEEIFNDIKTQTVIRLAEDEENEFYSFLTPEIFSFFIASFLFKKISSKNIDYTSLGKFDLSKSTLGKKVIKFLSLLLNSIDKEKLSTEIYNIIKFQQPYCFQTRFLIKNLDNLKINVLKTKEIDSWSLNPIEIEDGYALVTSTEDKNHFKIKQYPVTNIEFKKFLESNYGAKWKMNSNTKIEYDQFKIDYHLYLWRDDDVQKEEYNKPIVYIGWFAAIDYCNWLSIENNLTPFYSFKESKNGKIIVDRNKNSIGYRLPTSQEWLIVASEGNPANTFPWEHYTNTQLKEKYKSELLSRSNTLRPILNFKQNNYGVYGMIGEVKEWTDDKEVAIVSGTNRPIKGATLLTDFSFKKIISIPGQNTNVDVGFRVVKSVSEDERTLINKNL